MSADPALVAAINRLRKERNAVILSHYYQEPAIQDIADFIGDSLELSRKAANYRTSMATFDSITFRSNNALVGLTDPYELFLTGPSALETYVSESGTGLKWRYAEPPQVESVYPGVSTVTCRFTGFLDGV